MPWSLCPDQVGFPMSFTRIQPRRRLSFFEWKEIFEYRDLLYYLSLRDIQVRYKQTSLGVVWVILQPLVPAVIFAVLFGNFARLPSNGQPYLLMVFTGLIPWSLFSNTIGRAGGAWWAMPTSFRRSTFRA